LPFTYNGDSMGIAVEGIPDPPPDQWPDVIYRAIGPGYFNTMGIPLVRGREFTDGDTIDTTRGVVIGEKTAKHYWPNQDPIGKRLKPGATSDNETPWRTVIGVVKDVRQNDFIAEPKMQMYFSYKQVGQLVANALIVRTSALSLSGFFTGAMSRFTTGIVESALPLGSRRLTRPVRSLTIARCRSTSARSSDTSTPPWRSHSSRTSRPTACRSRAQWRSSAWSPVCRRPRS
jgi:hypothetical protein